MRKYGVFLEDVTEVENKERNLNMWLMTEDEVKPQFKRLTPLN